MKFNRKNLNPTNKSKQRGSMLIEYVLLVALVAFAAIPGVGALAEGINTAFQNATSKLATTDSGSGT